MMHLTLDHGITGASTTAMAWFGVLIGHRYAEYRLGFQYGTLARELVNRHGYDAYEAKTLLPLDQLSVWTQPLSFTIECAKACFTAAVTHGDMTMACFAACHQAINFLSRGDHLDGVLTSIDRGLAFVRKTHFQDVETILMVQRGYVEFLRTPVIGTWTASQVLPEALLPASPERPCCSGTGSIAVWRTLPAANLPMRRQILRWRAGTRGLRLATSICWITISTAPWRFPAS